MAQRLDTTVVSTKGQVILPKAIREARRWGPGTQLIVEALDNGVLLRSAPVFAETRLDDVVGTLAYRGRPKTVEEMDAGIVAEARRRNARD